MLLIVLTYLILMAVITVLLYEVIRFVVDTVREVKH